MNKVGITAFVVVLLLLVSCSSEKRTTKSSLRSYTANHIVKEIDENSFRFDKLQTKLDIRFKDDRNTLGLKGQLRMQRDSVVWISLSLKVGIEVGRLMITRDSVMFMNRNAKTYMAESLDVFNDKLPFELSLEFFQDLLVGNDTQIKDGDRYKVSTENDKYKLEITKKEKRNIKNTNDSYLLIKDVWVVPETFRISKYKIKEYDNDKRKIQLEYAGFNSYNESLMPTKIHLNLSSDYDLDIEINYSNVVLDNDMDFPFNITEKFDRIYVW